MELLADFRICGRAYTHISAELVELQIRPKVIVAQSYVNFTLYAQTCPGGAFSHDRQKTQLELPDLAEFLIFFTKKVPVT